MAASAARFIDRCTLRGRSMVGHAALDRGIGVRIPAPQPDKNSDPTIIVLDC